MNLPAITIPQIDLPFEIPLLLHPPVDHFAIALPIVVLIIEFINLFARRRALSLLSLFMMIAMIAAVVAAYFTGSVDGKEVYPLLNEAGQAELEGHKILGTYLMLASGVVLLFKLGAMLASRGLVKAFYLLVLVLYAVGILKQGKDGGELVYEFGAHVAMVKTLDEERFDLKKKRDELEDELETAKEALESLKATAIPQSTEAAETTTKSVMSLSDTNTSERN